jgi:hypothetical protein
MCLSGYMHCNSMQAAGRSLPSPQWLKLAKISTQGSTCTLPHSFH